LYSTYQTVSDCDDGKVYAFFKSIAWGALGGVLGWAAASSTVIFAAMGTSLTEAGISASYLMGLFISLDAAVVATAVCFDRQRFAWLDSVFHLFDKRHMTWEEGLLSKAKKQDPTGSVVPSDCDGVFLNISKNTATVIISKSHPLNKKWDGFNLIEFRGGYSWRLSGSKFVKDKVVIAARLEDEGGRKIYEIQYLSIDEYCASQAEYIAETDIAELIGNERASLSIENG
jgi:hypothetical protein